MNHMNLEVVGIEETRAVEAVRNEQGTVLDLIPGRTSRWLVIAARPNGETIRAEVSDADWKRVVEPLLEAGRVDWTAQNASRVE